jgi:hypothetical protein
MSERQPEVDARHETLLVDGDDAGHVLPPTELDPYTPEPSPSMAAATALWIAIAVAIFVVAVSVYAATR